MDLKALQIPIFPLDIFLLPGEHTQLYIFEDRYKQLVADCLSESRPFGIVYSNRMNHNNLGCLVTIEEVKEKFANGEMDIVVKATGIFSLQEFWRRQEDRLYPSGMVKMLSDVENFRVENKTALAFRRYMIKNEILNSEYPSYEDLGVMDIANELQLGNPEKLEFAEIGRQDEMERYINNYIRYVEFMHVQEKSVYENIYLN